MISIYFETITKILKYFPKKITNLFLLVQCLVIITGFIDLFGFVVFIPVVTVIFDPEILSSNLYFSALRDVLNAQSDQIFQVQLLLMALFIFILRSGFLIFSFRIQQKFAFVVSQFVGLSVFKFYLGLNFLKFQTIDQSKLNRELTISPFHFAKFIITPTQFLLGELIITIVIIIGIALYDINAFLLLLFSLIPAAYFFYISIKKKIKLIGENINEIEPLMYENCLKGIYGFIDVKLRNKESYLYKEYEIITEKINHLNILNSTFNLIPAKFFELISVIGIVLIFIYSNFYLNDPIFAIKILTIYVAACYRIIPSLSKVVPSLMMLEQYSYLFKIYKAPLTQKSKNHNFFDFNKKLEFQNLTLEKIYFSYGHNKVLENINLSINCGDMIGIVGESGSGKSTLVNILAGLYVPDNGFFLIDGINISNDNRNKLRFGVAYVQQESYLEKGSLLSNIAFLDSKPDYQKAYKAAMTASLSDLMFQKKINHIEIDEFGKNLSVGQKQRVMIARALYNDCNLILFDESTSSLDNQTEKEITDAFLELKKNNVTVVIIAHRYSTLKHTDKIFEISNKTIKQELSYKQLLKNTQ